MKRVGNLWNQLLSDDNLYRAIYEVNSSHRWLKGHKPNYTTAKIELNIDNKVKELRQVLNNGFVPNEPKVEVRYDPNAKKERTISMPRLWPDQYVHHALIQVIEPVLMRGMDPWCCGSIPGRGASYARKGLTKWIKYDKRGTKWCLSLDIHHFYDSITSHIIMNRMRQLIKDHRILDLIERIISQGVLIGVYTSQWLANAILQPLDNMIRQSGLCSHYVRYMDNITILGPNKRKLKQLKNKIEIWLAKHELKIKNDWQLFRVNQRLPSAVGYRYNKDYTLIKKNSLFRMKRRLRSYRRKRDKGKHITAHEASGLLSNIGQLRHCNNYNLYAKLYKGERIERELKQIIRSNQKGLMTWNTYLEKLATKKHL